MIRLQMDDGEARLLSEILESTLGNLSYQIADTDTRGYRDGLKARRDVLKRLSQQLTAELENSPAPEG